MARKILLADDSVTAQNMGRKILADAGYEVVTVNNGSAALKKIAELKPDLVILDVYMPGYSGLEVCQRLKESQDSSRIPVLLSVGKLEPFKPEEAQRVRADGFIVKPFEASELLSALSRLEDKVVPRAEPSKPGRFARAIATQEESSRGSRSDSNSEENGWKSRIGFPHQKTETQEKVADDSSIYNPINRDLRTVVETPEEKKQQERQRDDQPAAAGKAKDPSVDVAALAAGLPKDVTPEEISAITAAAAQLQAIQENRQGTEPAAHSAPEQVEAGKSAGAGGSDNAEQASPITGNVPEPAAGEAEAKPVAALLSAEASRTDEHAEAEPEAPVTMAANPGAATAEQQGTSRWQAVAVALEADEAGISLDQEMQKAYAAFVAEENTSREAFASAEPTLPPVIAESSNSQPSPESSTAVGVAGAEIAQDVTSAPQADLPVPTAANETLPDTLSGPAAVTAEAKPVEVIAVESRELESDEEPAVLAQRACDLAQQELSQLASVQLSAAAPDGAVAAVEPVPSMPLVSSTEPVNTEAPATVDGFAAIVRSDVRADERKVESKTEDPEEVKNTAAAWASWRQIRDAGDSKPSEPSRQEFEAPISVPAESAALAAAAGAEQAAHDATTPAEENPSDIASIVDSVLANLRPRLMAEISKKMAEKK